MADPAKGIAVGHSFSAHRIAAQKTEDYRVSSTFVCLKKLCNYRSENSLQKVNAMKIPEKVCHKNKRKKGGNDGVKPKCKPKTGALRAD